MNPFCLTTMTIVFLLCFTIGIQAQTTQTKLNHVELMKQFLGTWKCDIGKDTTEFWEGKSYGTGLVCDFKDVTKDKIVSEGKSLWGYNKELDKFIVASMFRGKDIGIYGVWFTSKNKYVVIPFSDISYPEKASFKMEGDIKSTDMFVETTIVNNIPVKTDTWTRVK